MSCALGAFGAVLTDSCSKESVFDPDWMPSANPSVRQGSASGSTPTNGTTLPTPQPYTAPPFGKAPPHKTGAEPNPSTDFWRDEFPRAVDPGRHAPSLNDIGGAQDRHQQAQISPNDPAAWQGITDMAAPSTNATTGTGGTTFGLDATDTAGVRAAPNGNLTGFNEMGIDDLDISKWFDIPNLSFDESSLEQMVGMAQDSGATFQPGSFAMMFP